jgi:putative ABC transport system substrate-binding protein
MCAIKKADVLSLLFVMVLLAVAVMAEAQQPAKLQKIGYLSGVYPSAEAARRDAFTHGLRELGYVEGKNIVIEYRYSEGKYERLNALMGDLLHHRPDIIVTGGGPSTRVAKQATSTIPIVMTNDPDPIANGFVGASLRGGSKCRLNIFRI